MVLVHLFRSSSGSQTIAHKVLALHVDITGKDGNRTSISWHNFLSADTLEHYAKSIHEHLAQHRARSE